MAALLCQRVTEAVGLTQDRGLRTPSSMLGAPPDAPTVTHAALQDDEPGIFEPERISPRLTYAATRRL
jgi:hypothetical protein